MCTIPYEIMRFDKTDKSHLRECVLFLRKNQRKKKPIWGPSSSSSSRRRRRRSRSRSRSRSSSSSMPVSQTPRLED